MLNEDPSMTEADIKALERRNNTNQDLIIEELKEIKAVSKSNERALRGKNGDVGIVGDVRTIKTELSGIGKKSIQYDKNFAELNKLLYGEGKDKVGIIGEQITLRNYVFKDLKPAIQKMSWWFFALVVGLILTGLLNANLFGK